MIVTKKTSKPKSTIAEQFKDSPLGEAQKKVEQLEKELQEPEVEPVFKGSIKRRFWQYTDTLGNIAALIGAFFAIDFAVDLLYKNKIADTQSAAQQFTVQDIEGVLLALIIIGIAFNVIKLILEVSFDSFHWFLESDKDQSWTAFKAFRKLNPWQQWIVFAIFFCSSLYAFSHVLQAIV